MTATRYHSSPPALGDLLAGRPNGRHMERTGNKVRRNSVDVDDERNRRFIRPVDEDEVAAILQAADRYNLEHKEEGKYVGPFRGRGIEVLRHLLRMARKQIFDPTHQQIADALKIGRRTVCRIMKALYLAGFLEWQRQSREVDDGGGQPRRHQAANLYRFNLPKSRAGLVSRLVAQRTKRKIEPPKSARVVDDAELTLRPQLWAQSLGRGGALAGVLDQLAKAVGLAGSGAKLALSYGLKD